ncbi:EF-hand domain-containing protein [Luteolibacter pohnpeiensis]|uniref:EF-hand domain-containing protein n=1 Tax=Luteolibacter pohnpeiensis TaxID=454153 RepID=A0A934VW93_9BACT|nr:EF-hand domain-containing protein [Luteolibacter pohnpeiensis]MBK1882578.1 EF-hand domain-containing protein [Luteolibacter pohnpeiensis]
MKTKLLSIAGILLGTAAISFAQEKPEPPKRAERKIPEEVLKKFDKDGDGKLSDEERKAMRAERQAEAEKMRKENLEKYDANKDGKLDEEETKKMREDRRKEMFAKFDKDGDGKLSEEEMKAMREANPQRGQRGARGEGRPPKAPEDAPKDTTKDEPAGE